MGQQNECFNSGLSERERSLLEGKTKNETMSGEE